MVSHLTDIFPEVTHVTNVNLDQASDAKLWQYAKEHQFVILTKDSDFNDYASVFGFPPKVIWLKVGNRTTNEIKTVIKTNHSTIEQFSDDPKTGLLVII